MKDSASKSAARTERRQGRHRKSLSGAVEHEGACAIVSEPDSDSDHEQQDEYDTLMDNEESGPLRCSFMLLFC